MFNNVLDALKEPPKIHTWVNIMLNATTCELLCGIFQFKALLVFGNPFLRGIAGRILVASTKNRVRDNKDRFFCCIFDGWHMPGIYHAM